MASSNDTDRERTDPFLEVSVIDNVDRLCEVFERVFGSSILETKDKDTIVEAVKEKVQDSCLHRPYDFGSTEDMKQTVICEHTSQFTGCHIWIDEDSEEKRAFITETEVAADEFRRRGFTEYSKNAVAELSMIPDKVMRPGMEVPLLERPTPTDVILPECIPPPRSDMTLAATVVEQFEERIVDIKANQVYAPMKFWSKDKRTKVPKRVSATLYNRLKCYYAIKKLYANQDPETIILKQKQMMEDAARDVSASAGERESNAEFWYKECLKLYNNQMDTSE